MYINDNVYLSYYKLSTRLLSFRNKTVPHVAAFVFQQKLCLYIDNVCNEMFHDLSLLLITTPICLKMPIAVECHYTSTLILLLWAELLKFDAF